MSKRIDIAQTDRWTDTNFEENLRWNRKQEQKLKLKPAPVFS